MNENLCMCVFPVCFSVYPPRDTFLTACVYIHAVIDSVPKTVCFSVCHLGDCLHKISHRKSSLSMSVSERCVPVRPKYPKWRKAMVKENNGQIHHATDPRREMPIFEVNLISWNPFNNLRELSAHCNPRQLGALHH